MDFRHADIRQPATRQRDAQETARNRQKESPECMHAVILSNSDINHKRHLQNLSGVFASERLTSRNMFKFIFKTLRNNTLVGMMIVIPVIATILIFNFLFRLATAWLPASTFPELAAIWSGYALRLLTLVAVLIALFLIGLLARNFIGRRVYALSDRLFARIPLVKRIYLAVQKISEALFAQRKSLFQEVVLVEYPRKGVYSMAFVTTEVVPSIAEPVVTDRVPGEPCVNLFIATSPNPTSGLMIIVPRSQVRRINISVTDALTFIMSAGTVQPGDAAIAKLSLLDRLEGWLQDRPLATPSADVEAP